MSIEETKSAPHMFRVPLIALVGLLAFLAILSLLPQPSPRTIEQMSDARRIPAEDIRLGQAPIPEFTDETKAKLEKSTGFQHLISYTDHGFEPSRLTSKRGETVRFTNNSSYDLWVAADGRSVQIYPRSKSTCGSSDLDSCESFSPQDFWEFTFDVAGEWHIINNLDKTKGAIVRVE